MVDHILEVKVQITELLLRILVCLDLRCLVLLMLLVEVEEEEDLVQIQIILVLARDLEVLEVLGVQLPVILDHRDLL